MPENIVSTIQCDINNTCFVWKHPIENFGTGSQLIVHESQEAVFFMNGQALDSFGPGRHTLTTQNMPIVGKFFNRVAGDTTPFHCEIYFINKTEQMAIKWGTSSKMEYIEPSYGFPIQLGASGEMFLKISNARQLLIKVVGTDHNITQSQLIDKFKAFLQLRLKNYVVALIKQEKINIFEIDEYLERISQSVLEKLRNDFFDYGVALENFIITTIIKPEDDRNYRRYKDLHFRTYADIAEAKLRQQVGVIDQQTKAQQMVIEAEGLAKKRSLEGYTYQQERQFDVAERVAENEATGEFANMGIGMGMITGIGGAIGNNVGGLINNALNPVSVASTAIKCNKCGTVLASNAKFCGECGERYVAPATDTVICPSCGENVQKGKFCPACGQRLEKSACPKCGKEITHGSKFCGECGEKLI